MNTEEIWKVIPDTNELYEASNLGKIRRASGFVSNNNNGGLRKVGRELSQKTKSNNYKEVNLYIEKQIGKSRYVHRLVVSAFLGKIKEGLQVNHIDGDKSNNNINNLEIVSASDNMKHSYRVLKNKNTSFKGEAHGCSKLRNEDVLKIREMFSNGMTPKEINFTYSNVCYGTICSICYRKTWKHI